MQTSFTAEQLEDPEIAEADSIIRTCVHYGFCTAGCPTYVLLRDENDAPRGRIDLIRQMLEKGGPPDAKTVGHLDRCLSCLACMSTCAIRVDYMHLIDHARVHIERTYRRPPGDRLLRGLIAALLPHPRRFRAALALAALARPAAKALPKRLANLVRLAPAALPAPSTPPGVYPAEGARRLRVALLAGCAQTVLAPQINAATVRLLTRHGCEVVVAPDAECCGALTLHMGKEDAAKAAARRTIDAWSREIGGGGLDAIVVNASGCGTTVKDYAHLFQHDGGMREAAGAVAARALDVSELLDRIGLKADTPRRYRVAYHDACSMRHAQRVTREPRALLAAAGFDVRDVPEAHFCCGSAGTYNLLQPDIAEALGRRKAGHIGSTGAEIVALGNVGCLVQIGRFTTLPVVHTVELLDWASGGPMPEALAGRTLSELPPPAAGAAAADPGIGIW